MMVLGQLFKDALTSAVDGKAVVFDYGDTNDFSRLWGDAGNDTPAVLNQMNGKQATIIVWDGRARNENDPSEKHLAPHLTPLDWALAFSIKVLGNTKTAENARFHIHIVDLTGKAHYEWAMRMRHQLLAEMPWVTLHAPLIPKKDGEVASYRQGYRPILGEEGLLKQISGNGTLRPAKTLADGFRSGRGEQHSELAKQWAASLTQSYDHHDVNNVIGPDILARAQHKREGLPSAFLTRLAWSGHDLETVGGWKSWKAHQVAEALFNRPLSAFVVDDQLQQGWGRFVCRLFNEEQFDETRVPDNAGFVKLNHGSDPNQKVKVYGCLSSQPLIDFLKTAFFDRRVFSQQIRVDHDRYDTRPQPQLILLDLRLYAGITEARTRARKLLDIINSRVQPGLAWREIEKSEVEHIADWCDGKSDDSRVADEALLLLPRLLALALPLTPIILFSSTGQAWIRERLKPYQNVFTSFEKPRVLSKPEAVEASIAALHEGLDKAVGMMRLRLQLAHAQQAVAKAMAARPPEDDRLSTHHIEIYADETRSLEEGITSGLAVCVYPSRGRADALQAKLWVEHGRAGVVWAKVPGGGVPKLVKGADISKIQVECETQVQLLANLLGQGDVDLGPEKRQLWSVVTTRVPASAPEKRQVSLSAFPDGPLDKALRFNLDFSLHVLIPYMSAQERLSVGGTVDIYLATRVVPYDAADQDFANKLCVAFDLGQAFLSKDGTKYLVPTSSLSRDGSLGTAFPLIRGWLHEWRNVSPVPAEQITHIKTTSLDRGTREGINSIEAHGRRLFHDIADWACTASGKLHDIPTNQWVWPLNEQLKRWNCFPHWFVSTDSNKNFKNAGNCWFETDSENALVLMDALRASLRGKFGDDSENDALRLILRNSYVEKCDYRLLSNEYCAQQRLILWMLRRELEHARGRGLHSLLAADAARPGGATDQARAGDQPVAETTAGEQQGEVSDQGLGVEQPVSPSGDETSPEVLANEERPQATRQEQLPQLLDGADLKSRFPGYDPYEVVWLTKFGDMFFKPFGEQGSQGTHWAHDRELAFQLGADGWASPAVVYGMEVPSSSTGDPATDIYLASFSREEKSLRIVAARLADGRWKVVGAPY